MNTVFVRYGGRGATTAHEMYLYLLVTACDEQGNKTPIEQKTWGVALYPDDMAKKVEKRISDQMAEDYETDEQHVIVLG